MLTIEIYGLTLSSNPSDLERREEVLDAVNLAIDNLQLPIEDAGVIEMPGVRKDRFGKVRLLIRVYTSDSKFPKKLVEALCVFGDVEILRCNAKKKFT